jgi:transcriptional regulator with XRE-family HTH domain
METIREESPAADSISGRVAAFIRRKMREADVSFRQIEQRSGGRVTYATVHALSHARHKDIGVSTLAALADGLGVPLAELVAVAVGRDDAGAAGGLLSGFVHKYGLLGEEGREALRPHLELLDREAERLLSLYAAQAAQSAADEPDQREGGAVEFPAAAARRRSRGEVGPPRAVGDVLGPLARLPVAKANLNDARRADAKRKERRRA